MGVYVQTSDNKVFVMPPNLFILAFGFPEIQTKVLTGLVFYMQISNHSCWELLFTLHFKFLHPTSHPPSLPLVLTFLLLPSQPQYFCVSGSKEDLSRFFVAFVKPAEKIFVALTVIFPSGTREFDSFIFSKMLVEFVNNLFS